MKHFNQLILATSAFFVIKVKSLILLPTFVIFFNFNSMAQVFSLFQEGICSFYAEYFHGRLTANGEHFNMHALTAAHLSLPFGTRIRVTNLNNHHSVVVRVNDRGPYWKNRVLDVSKEAARQLGMMESGIARVKIEIVKEIPPILADSLVAKQHPAQLQRQAIFSETSIPQDQPDDHTKDLIPDQAVKKDEKILLSRIPTNLL